MTTTSPTSLTGTYLLDHAHTRLGFSARQAMVAKVHGSFGAFDGRLHLDFDDLERSSAEVTINVASVNTGNAERDEHLLTSFFDVACYPRITFRSTAVHRLGYDRFRLTGALTIKRRTRPVTIVWTYMGVTKETYGNIRAGFEGRATLNRRDWGVVWDVALDSWGVLVSDKIALELEVAALKADPYL